jgi:hypothetical protein
MASSKEKATAKSAAGFRDLKSNTSPKGGSMQWGAGIGSGGTGKVAQSISWLRID